MFPRLYDFSNSANGYEHNGYGLIRNVLSGSVKEALNGEYTLKMSVFAKDRLALKIKPNMCIMAKPNPYDDDQIFVITSVKVKGSNVEVQGSHIKEAYFNNVFHGDKTNDGFEYTGTPEEIMQEIDSYSVLPIYFDFSSDITTSGAVRDGIDAVSYGDLFSKEGGMRDVFRGDLKYNNFNIQFLKHRGNTTPNCILRDGHNISSFQYQVNNVSEYTHVLPYADVKVLDTSISNAESVRLFGDLARASTSDYSRIYPVNFTNRFTNKHGYVDPTSGLGYADATSKLTQLGASYVSNRPRIKTPSVTVNVKYEPSSRELDTVQLGDSVRVISERYEYAENHRVTETEFDFVNEKYIDISLGSRKFNLYNFLKRGLD